MVSPLLSLFLNLDLAATGAVAATLLVGTPALTFIGLIGAGLTIDFLNEHDIVVWQAFSFLVEAGEDQFALPEGQPRVPLSFSIGATRRG